VTAAFLVDEFLDAVTSQLDPHAGCACRKGSACGRLSSRWRNFRIPAAGVREHGHRRQTSACAARHRARPAPARSISSSRRSRGAMIEENTISARDGAGRPSLQEAGLKREDAQQLERLGIRTVAQLQGAAHIRARGLDGITRLTSGAGSRRPIARRPARRTSADPQRRAGGPAAPAPARRKPLRRMRSRPCCAFPPETTRAAIRRPEPARHRHTPARAPRRASHSFPRRAKTTGLVVEPATTAISAARSRWSSATASGCTTDVRVEHPADRSGNGSDTWMPEAAL